MIGTLTPAVRRLVIANGVVFLAQLVVPPFVAVFGLYPPAVLSLQVWRLFTYMFLHGGLFHLLLNMFVLAMFGSQLERAWGSRRFLRYYLLCGIGAGLFTLIPVSSFFDANHIGASGAVYGVLLAFGLLFPETRIYLYFLFPIKASHLVLVLGFISVASSLSATQDGVSHIAHLGGLAAGYYLLNRDGRLPPKFRLGRYLGTTWNDAKSRWTRRRNRARFNRYDRRHRPGNRETLH